MLLQQQSTEQNKGQPQLTMNEMKTALKRKKVKSKKIKNKYKTSRQVNYSHHAWKEWIEWVNNPPG